MLNVPLKAVQELMRHQSIEMTMRYAHLSPGTRSAAVEVLVEGVNGRRSAGSWRDGVVEGPPSEAFSPLRAVEAGAAAGA